MGNQDPSNTGDNDDNGAPPLGGRDNVERALRQEVHVVHFPSPRAGESITVTTPGYGTYSDTVQAENNPYAPFTSKRDFEFAMWAKTRGPGSNALDELLKIDGVQEDLGLAYKNTRELNKIIDTHLPSSRPRFRCKEILVAGEVFDVYYRDPLECIKALIGDPNFATDLVWTPERHYADPDKTIRVYHEMYTGKWWWNKQKEVERNKPGATIVPVIISSDKTRLTTFKGKSAYPVYLTIGNLPKELRRKPSLQSQILLAYLPTTRLEHITNKAARRRTIANLYHACMRKILSPLKKPALDGTPIASGDGVVRRCHTIFAAHVGDYPEQVLVTGVKTGECPCCPVPRDELGNHEPHPFRDLDAVLNALETADIVLRAQACAAAGIKPIHQPYWEDLPYSNPFRAITPDILHQLHQGVIKHLVSWVRSAFSETEIDARCRRLPRNHHVRVFTKGITSLSQLTGREHADICRILLGLVADMPLPGGVSPVRLVRCVRAILDFLYLAQYPVHTDNTLALLAEALDRFHVNKDIFIQLNIRTGWNIPKLHFLDHYRELTIQLGSPDNFNTEYTERLHIDLAKDAYEATNSKDEFPQMTVWLERREKLFRHKRFVAWCLAGRPALVSLLATGDAPPRVKMTKHPSKPAVHFDTLINDYHAKFFREALTRYAVRLRHPQYTDAQVEELSLNARQLPRSVAVYHKAKFWLGDEQNPRLLSDEFDVLHATPARKNKRGQVIDGHFDPAMINDNQGAYCGVTGYRIARVRAIFSIRHKDRIALFGDASHDAPPFLAYVEWFTDFTNPVANLGLYKIKHSVDQDGERLASIISLDRIRRSTYLFPVFGALVPREWTSGNVLDECKTFYVDSFSDRHAYHTIY
ncbi:hypothetical protein BXZ70DRAFT_890478 [Cristinia sonorae]|uniref:Uncharacterized protein n=1 Tax=Cristinia sonorae TaxID=1940300 RepID=A0A8K0USB5_9AGAR|nr:hypothetical protein BXZ70DRAFT_890478 [Cristinia sonorae]